MRAFLNAGRSLPLPQKYYYYGPMFRRERPQQGRLRQVRFLSSFFFFEKKVNFLQLKHQSVSSIWS